MRRLMSLACAGLAIIAASTPASASSSVSPGYVLHITTYSYGLVTFEHSVDRTTAPSCQLASAPRIWEIKTDTATGQAMLASLLTAYSLHLPISVIGKGTCQPNGGTEDVDYFYT